MSDYRVEIYSVGNANTIAISKNKNTSASQRFMPGECILFDCGEKGNLYGAVEKAKTLQPKAIIISHWHEDHYNMLNALDCSKLKLLAYPDIKICKNSQTAARIKNLVSRNVKTVIELKDDAGLKKCRSELNKLGFKGIELFLGQNKMPNGQNIGYNNSINDSCVIMSIEKNNKRVILPGDCSYFSWPATSKLDIKQTDYLVLPHHGGQVYVPQISNNPSNAIPEIYLCRSGASIEQVHRDFLLNAGVITKNNIHPSCSNIQGYYFVSFEI